MTKRTKRIVSGTLLFVIGSLLLGGSAAYAAYVALYGKM